MATQNLLGKIGLLCSFGGGDIGRAACDIKPGPQVGSIFLPPTLTFSAAQTVSQTAFMSALTTAAAADNKRNRVYAVGNYIAVNPSGDAKQEQTFGYGKKVRTRRAKIQNDFTMDYGKCYHKNLVLTLDNKDGSFSEMQVTDQGGGIYAIWGKKVVSTAGVVSNGGCRLETLYVEDMTADTGSAVSTFTVTIGYANSSELNVNYTVMLVNGNPIDAINGLMGAELQATSTASNVISVTASLACGGEDLHDTYTTELAQATAWLVTNATPGSANFGNAITVTTVASTGTGWNVTIAATGTDPDNPGTGGIVYITTAAPSVLAAAPINVSGIEGIGTNVTLF